MKVDAAGNLFATGPGGVLVFAPDGTHLGTFATGEATANCGWGDDGSTLYITADMYIGRIRMKTKGLGSEPDSLPRHPRSSPGPSAVRAHRPAGRTGRRPGRRRGGPSPARRA